MLKSRAIIMYSALIIAILPDKDSERIKVHKSGPFLHELQTTELKRRFEKSPYLKRGETVPLAKKLNLTPKAVHDWFYQQRVKVKKKDQEKHQGI